MEGHTISCKSSTPLNNRSERTTPIAARDPYTWINNYRGRWEHLTGLVLLVDDMASIHGPRLTYCSRIDKKAAFPFLWFASSDAMLTHMTAVSPRR